MLLLNLRRRNKHIRQYFPNLLNRTVASHFYKLCGIDLAQALIRKDFRHNFLPYTLIAVHLFASLFLCGDYIPLI